MKHRIAPMWICLMCVSWDIKTACANTGTHQSDDVSDLNVAYTFTSDRHFATQSAIEVAISDVNNTKDILRNYKLKLVPLSPEAITGVALRYMFETLSTRPIAGFIGPGDFIYAESLKNFNTHFSIPQVGYTALSPYRQESAAIDHRYVSVLPSSRAFRAAWLKFISDMGWRKVAVLYDVNPRVFGYDHFEVTEFFYDGLRHANIAVLASLAFDSSQLNATDMTPVMSVLKEVDARVMLVFAPYIDSMKLIACEAYFQNLSDSRYVWLMNGIIERNWHTVPSFVSKCPRMMMEEALSGFFQIKARPFVDEGRPTAVGKAAIETWESILGRVKARYLEARGSLAGFAEEDLMNDYSYAYDATLLLVLALDRYTATRGKNASFYQRGVENAPEFREQVMNWVRSMRFTGVTGPISFDKTTGERIGVSISVQKWSPGEDGVFEEVAVFNTLTNSIVLNAGKKNALFKDGRVPVDGKAELRVQVTYNRSTTYAIWTAAAACIVLAIFFLCFNVYHRSRRLIKMSSPRLNNVIICGSMFSFIAVLIYGLDTNYISVEKLPILCNLIVGLLMYGFTFTFGALFSKTWRIYKVFTAAKTLAKIQIRDPLLFLMVGVLIAIDSILYLAWMVSNSYDIREEILSRTERLDLDAVEVLYYSRCSCSNQTLWLALVYVYKGLLLVVGAFLAWETRHVKVAALKDSWNIGVSIYIVLVIAVLGVVSAGVLYSTAQYEAAYVMVSMIVLLSSTVTMLLLFLPKACLLYARRAVGLSTTVSSRMTKTSPITHRTANGARLDGDEDLKTQVKLGDCEAKVIENEHVDLGARVDEALQSKLASSVPKTRAGDKGDEVLGNQPTIIGVADDGDVVCQNHYVISVDWDMDDDVFLPSHGHDSALPPVTKN